MRTVSVKWRTRVDATGNASAIAAVGVKLKERGIWECWTKENEAVKWKRERAKAKVRKGKLSRVEAEGGEVQYVGKAQTVWW